ncbi:MAG: hypothetical protein JWP92_1803 [Caulobacter sp.]|nr:hypothetical protein [Caulobacter sp.]
MNQKSVAQARAPSDRPRAQASQAVLDKMAEARRARIRAELLRSSNPVKNRRAILDHEAAARRAETEADRLQIEAADYQWAETAVRETERLALNRGEAVAHVVTEIATWARGEDGGLIRDPVDQTAVLKRERAVVRRMGGRTGLMTAFERGDLDGAGAERPIDGRRLLQVALRYRRAYETAEGLTSPSRDLGQPRVQRCRPSSGPHERVFEAREQLRNLRRGLTPKQRPIIDAVCGLDLSPAAAAAAAGIDPKTAKARLRKGLVAMGETLDWW